MVLLHGDAFRVREASLYILRILVPRESDAFSISRFNGRMASWDEIEGALRTPSLFSAAQVVVVEDAPYFTVAQRKADAMEKVIDLWREGIRDGSSNALMDLLGSEGWDYEQFEKARAASDFESLTDNAEAAAELVAVCEYARAQGKAPAPGKGDARNRLLAMTEEGLPGGAVLIMLASQVDRRARVYKKMADAKAVVDLSVERERNGRIRRETLEGFLDDRLKRAGKRIESRAREMVLARAGDELWAFHQELEKLFLYCGENPRLTAADVEDVFLDQAEGWVFDLTESLARKDRLAALGRLGRLVAAGEHPLRLLGAIASEVRKLLATRQLLDGDLRGIWHKGMSFADFQRHIGADVARWLTRSAYVNYLTFQRAENFTTRELLRYMELIRKTDIRLKSSTVAPATAMEGLLLEMCSTTGASHDGSIQG